MELSSKYLRRLDSHRVRAWRKHQFSLTVFTFVAFVLLFYSPLFFLLSLLYFPLMFTPMLKPSLLACSLSLSLSHSLSLSIYLHLCRSLILSLPISIPISASTSTSTSVAEKQLLKSISQDLSIFFTQVRYVHFSIVQYHYGFLLCRIISSPFSFILSLPFYLSLPSVGSPPSPFFSPILFSSLLVSSIIWLSYTRTYFQNIWCGQEIDFNVTTERRWHWLRHEHEFQHELEY